MTDPVPSPATDSGGRYLIVNAEDFGTSKGINRGIIECHRNGIVTSASLMVTGRAVDDAVSAARENPALSLGLHFDVWGEEERHVRHAGRQCDARRVPAANRSISGVGRANANTRGFPPPRSPRQASVPLLPRVGEALRIPLRDASAVRYVGAFYAQWEWMVTELKYVGVGSLQEMLRRDVPVGFTEIACHPGYMSDGYQAAYGAEREVEIATLTDPRVRQTLEEEGLGLISYREYASLA